MIVKRWDYGHKEYIRVNVPSDWHIKVIAGRGEVVNCVTCGRHVSRVDTFESIEVMNNLGSGYLVCPYCHAAEEVRKSKYNKEQTEFDWEIIKDGYVYRCVHGTESYAKLAADTFGGKYRRCEERRDQK